jgi:AcrR family transcriptional regulator
MPKLSDFQQEQRRARILDAAEQSFARNGFHRTTMQDICREAGVSAGALYLYFPSKEALMEGIATRSREEVLENFAKMDKAADFGTALAQLMEDCILRKPIYKSVIWLEICAEATRNPAILNTHGNCQKHIHDALVAMLENAQKAGRIDPLQPIPDIVETMSVIADGLFLRRAVEPEFKAEQVGQTILSLMAGLLRPVAAAEAHAAPGKTSEGKTSAHKASVEPV